MKKIKLTKKRYILISSIFTLFLLLMIISMPVETIKIDYENYENKIEFKGIYLAQEFVLHKGYVDKSKLKYKNGEKVAKGILITDTVRSIESGILINFLDGYENKFSSSNIEVINRKSIEQVIEKQNEQAGIKVLNNSEWYIYACIGEMKGFKKGQLYDIQLGSKYYSIEISKVINKSDETYLLMKLRNDLNITNLQRGLTGFIIKSRNKGFVLPKSTIVEYKGSQGVFIKYNDYAEFRKIEIVQENNDVYVVIPDASSKRKLQQYDQVILKPGDIKEGVRVK